MEDYLFHNVSEEEKGRIKSEAKKLLDSFSEKLSRAKVPEEEPLILRDEFEREEKDGEDCNPDFRKIMLENAPEKDSDFIIAEKKKWE